MNNKNLMLINIKTGLLTKTGNKLKIKADGMNPVTGDVINVTSNGFILAINKSDVWYNKWVKSNNKKIITFDNIDHTITDSNKMVKK